MGFRERTLATRFGEVRLRRRLYREEPGGYHVVLDEYIGLSAHQAATPAMQAMCTLLCGELSFRKAAGFREQWRAGMRSPSTCWRPLPRTGAAAVRAGEAEVEAVFGRGEPIALIGERCVERWYREADGASVRWQQQPQSHLELCRAMAYEGWERLPGTREGYRLREKRVSCPVGDGW